MGTFKEHNKLKIYSISIGINIILLLFLFVSPIFGNENNPEFIKKQETIVPMDCTVVLEENAAEILAEAPNEVIEELAELEELDPEPEPEPKPLPPPPAPEVIPEIKDPPPPPPPEKPKEEVKEKPKEKSKDKPKEEVKPKEKPKEKPKPKQIKIGKRVGPVTEGKKDKTKQATEKKLSQAEIAKLLAAGATAGTKNQLPKNEASRVAGIIQRVFTEKCNEAGIDTFANKAPVLTVTFKRGRSPGAIERIALKQSSGNRAHDTRVLGACRSVRHINGISDSFLKSVDYKIDIRVFVD